METVENNKLIAKFVSKEKMVGSWYLPQHEELQEDRDEMGCEMVSHFRDDELKYHSSIEWIMDAVDKIESLTEESNKELGINGTFVLESIGKSSKFILDDGTRLFRDNVCDTKKESIYLAVVQLIEWYNNITKRHNENKKA